MKNKGSLYVGILFVLLGGVFLFIESTRRLGAFWGISWGWGRLWPLLLLVAGAAFWLPVVIWWPRRAELAGLIIPGCILTVNGLILLYQALTGHWGSWSYLWALEPMAVGVSFCLIYYLTDRPKALLSVGGGLVAGGALFLLALAPISKGIFAILGPLLLIAIGLLLLIQGKKPAELL